MMNGAREREINMVDQYDDGRSKCEGEMVEYDDGCSMKERYCQMQTYSFWKGSKRGGRKKSQRKGERLLSFLPLLQNIRSAAILQHKISSQQEYSSMEYSIRRNVSGQNLSLTVITLTVGVRFFNTKIKSYSI
jgi:hypothetical protein